MSMLFFVHTQSQKTATSFSRNLRNITTDTDVCRQLRCLLYLILKIIINFTFENNAMQLENVNFGLIL